MRNFIRLFVAVLVVIAGVFVVTNLYFDNTGSANGRQYRVDAQRAAAVIEKSGLESLNVADYSSLVRIEKLDGSEKSFFEAGDCDYMVKVINGEYYRFDYRQNNENGSQRFAVNIALAVMSAAITAVMIYLYIRLIRPFERLRELPGELSRGNLTIPLKENKSRFFGKFIWGMNVLRENLEQQKAAELELQKEKKTLVLSISHDIKTPLSAIKLYSKALSKHLYDSRETQDEIALKINDKADEIENYVTQIIKASNEDFLNLSVDNGEFYLSEVVDKISAYYADKLGLLKTEFSITGFSNCILKGDSDRAVEVLQNIIENAVKYGDGGFIRVSFSDEENCRLIAVSNSGCTLSENEMPHIFDSFWRGSNSAGNSGSGLGLHICRQLMNKMNGEIYAALDGGTMSVTAVFRRA